MCIALDAFKEVRWIWSMSAVAEREQVGIDVRAQRPTVLQTLLFFANQYQGPVAAAEIAATVDTPPTWLTWAKKFHVNVRIVESAAIAPHSCRPISMTTDR